MQVATSLTIAVFLTAANSLHAFEKEQRTVSVTGTTVIRTVPDVITWRIQTIDTDKNLVRAKESSDEKLKKILSLRETLGIKPQDVQTSYLSIRREFERDQRGSRTTEFKHFAVNRSVTIQQRDLKRFDEYLTKLVSSAEMEVSFSFGTSRMHELRANARVNAVEVAKEKAEAMTKTLGAKIGKVLKIDEHRPAGYPRSFASNSAFSDVGGQLPVDATSGTFAPGAIEVRVSVHVTFEIK